LVDSSTVSIGTEYVGVIVIVGEPVEATVGVTRGEEVVVLTGVDALRVAEGVKTACNVSAAAV
jgi:hypothetical protein